MKTFAEIKEGFIQYNFVLKKTVEYFRTTNTVQILFCRIYDGSVKILQFVVLTIDYDLNHSVIVTST